MESMLPQGQNWRHFRETLTLLYSNDYKLAAVQPTSTQTGRDYETQLSIAANAARVLACTLQKDVVGENDCKQRADRAADDFKPALTDLANACTQLQNFGQQPAWMSRWKTALCTYGQALIGEHEVDLRKGDRATSLSPGALSAGREALLLAIADEQKDTGYTEATVLEGGQPKSVLIIAVVGQETMKAISATNTTICLAKPAPPSQASPEQIVSCSTAGSVPGKLKVINPLRTIRAILRASEVAHGSKYDYRILLAEMPRNRGDRTGCPARSLRAAALPGVEVVCPGQPFPRTDVPQLDAILSEAQSDHVSGNFSTRYSRDSEQQWTAIPIITPVPTYDIRLEQLVRPDTIAVLRTDPLSRTVCNTAADGSGWSCDLPINRSPWLRSQAGHSSFYLLMDAVSHANPGSQFVAPSGGNLNATDCVSGSSQLDDCKVSVMQFLLKRVQERGRSDIAILQRRDIFLGLLPPGYDDYSACEPLVKDDRRRCELRMALDRVLWKGDYSEIVMLSGGTLPV